MIKKVTYILMFSFMSLSAAMAESLPSNQVVLSASQMDQVTAGLAANVNAGALAFSSVLALTKVSTTANVVRTGSGNNPGLSGGAAIAGGLAQAGAAGNGASTSTSVTPTTDLAGPNVQTGQLSLHSAGQLVNISGSATVSVSAPTVNPL